MLVRRVLQGGSGVGKTAIALEYAHRYQDDYEAVLFVAGGRAANLHASFARLGSELGVDETVVSVRERLAGFASLLLIIDDSTQKDLEKLLPAHGHILVTSRSPVWTPPCDMVPVTGFTRKESLRLIESRISNDRLGDTRPDDLAEYLGDLPLALDWALTCQQSWDRSTGLLGMLEEQLRQAREEGDQSAIQGGDDALELPPSLGALWLAEFDQLDVLKPHAMTGLRMAALLAPDQPIPNALLTSAALGHDPAAELVGDRDALFPARARGWLKPSGRPGHHEMHLVVGRALRLAMNEEEKYRLCRLLLESMWDSACGGRADVGRSTEVWEWWSVVLPHVLALIEHPDTGAAALATDDWATLVRAVAELADRAASFLMLVGAAADAGPLFSRSLALTTWLDGSRAASVATAWRNLAGALLDGGDSKGALDAATRAQDIDVGCYGLTHPLLATDHRLLAACLLDDGDAAEADEHARHALNLATGRHLAPAGGCPESLLSRLRKLGPSLLGRPGRRAEDIVAALAMLARVARCRGQLQTATDLMELAVDASSAAPVEAMTPAFEIWRRDLAALRAQFNQPAPTGSGGQAIGATAS
jgi:tetratricopeptide (TPR) repeat protein